MFNYADQYNGAKLLESNPDATGAHHVLNGDMDRYYYSPCSEKKWITVQLSETVKVQRIRILNAEKFSSGPREFRVSE